MKAISARDAKYSFGKLIDMARAEPVSIQKHGRNVVVVLAVEEYERLIAKDRKDRECPEKAETVQSEAQSPQPTSRPSTRRSKKPAPKSETVLAQTVPSPPDVGGPDQLIKSKKRVADHGEVFTPAWLVDSMLDLVEDEAARIDARFLEPACGSGNFLVAVLKRKLATVEAKFGKSDFAKRHYALLALMCTYGIELLADNIAECRANMLEVLADYLGAEDGEEIRHAASLVLEKNIVHGDALTMKDLNGEPITFTEWGYLGRGKFQRREFRLDVLTGSSAFSAEDSLFAHLGKHEIFTPTKTYPTTTLRGLVSSLSETPQEAA